MSDLQPRQQSHYGWIPDLPDNRDHLFATQPETMAALPPAVDMRPQCPAQVYDQGRIGSCTANAIAGAFEFDLLRQQLMDFTIGSDSGAMIRDGVKSVAKVGVCAEAEWPYDDTPPGTSDGGWPTG